jgi:N-acetylmuramoyl-L-alanine amidase
MKRPSSTPKDSKGALLPATVRRHMCSSGTKRRAAQAAALALLCAVAAFFGCGGSDTASSDLLRSSPGTVIDTSVPSPALTRTTATDALHNDRWTATNDVPTTGPVRTTASLVRERPPATVSPPAIEASPVTQPRPPSSDSQAQAQTWTVVLDPGHQAAADNRPEPVGPGSADTKPRASSGTRGVVTGISEAELVLDVALILRDALAAAGINVVMTRTTNDVQLSNIERANIANEAAADLFVRIHADGSSDPSVSGIHVLYPASTEGWTDDIATASKEATTIAQRELIAATGALDRGIDARSDMTGFNWSDVPVILPEIGFMSNAAEDRLLATPEHRAAIATGLAQAIVHFLHSR